MYKKIALLSILVCSSTQYASELVQWFEIKPSYFLFSTSPMNHVYNKGGFEVQGSGTIPFSECFNFYTSIGYRKAWGHALNSCEKTSLTVIPVDIGLKPVFAFCDSVYYFFAIGPRYFYFRQYNKSPYVDTFIQGSGIGFFVNTGLNIVCTECLLLGIFAEYSHEKKKVCPKRPRVYSNGSVQIGGFAFGISLGYEY